MAALSVLRAGFGRLLRFKQVSSASPGQIWTNNSAKCDVVRLMSSGHKRTLQILPTNFEWRVYKDHLHFYLLLGLVPIGALITYCNVFIGRSELADIPEGYEPKHWEYYKHPITRFISRYLLDSQEKIYERHLHFVSKEKEKILMKQLEEKIDILVSQEGRFDSKRWYYIKGGEKQVALSQECQREQESTEGFK